VATWADVAAIVEAFQAAEGVARSDALYRALANRALGRLSTRVGHFESSWSNDGTATGISLSGRLATFPANLIDLVTAYWSGVQMDEAGSTGWLDLYDELWRSSTGTPTIFVREARGMILNREPTGSTSGLLVVHGFGSIPQFSESGTTNPLTYLPEPHQLGLADYMIANLPIELRNKTKEQIAVMQEARAQAAARWLAVEEACVADMMKRKAPPIVGG